MPWGHIFAVASIFIPDARETKPATESQVGRGEHRAAQLASSRQQNNPPRTSGEQASTR
jgi:hypothetical protein